MFSFFHTPFLSFSSFREFSHGWIRIHVLFFLLLLLCYVFSSGLGSRLHQGLEHRVSDNTGTTEWAMGNPHKWLYSSLSNLLGIGRNYYTLTLVFLLTHLSKSHEPALMGNLSLQSAFSVRPLGHWRCWFLQTRPSLAAPEEGTGLDTKSPALSFPTVAPVQTWRSRLKYFSCLIERFPESSWFFCSFHRKQTLL